MKIKVLQVVGNLRIGGAETVAMNIIRYIDRNKYEIHYLVYGNQIGDYENEVDKLGGKVIHINYKNGMGYCQYFSMLQDVYNQYGPYKIIHAHMMFHNAMILHSAKKIGVPLRVSHAHSTDDGGDKQNIIRRFVRGIYCSVSKIVLNHSANCKISCGEMAGIALYGKNVFKKSGIIIKNGIYIQKYLYDFKIRKMIRKKYCLDDCVVLACIGHFDRVKNHEYAINLLKRLSDGKSKYKLVLLGDGELRGNIELLVKKLNIGGNVLFMGNVDNVNEWLQAIDFVIMPSLFEGIPVSLIEAQTAGTICFVSDRISREVNLFGRVNFCELSEDFKGWLDIANVDRDYDRQIDATNLIKAGYDVKCNVHLLEDIYNGTVEG